MNKWQERFTNKMDLIRAASKDRFERCAQDTIIPTFEEFQEFTCLQGIQALAPLAKGGIRTFRFSITENAYVLITFRVATLEHCEAQTEFYMPHHTKLDPLSERLAFGDVEPAWARRIFEQALDEFVNAYVDSLGDSKQTAASAGAMP